MESVQDRKLVKVAELRRGFVLLCAMGRLYSVCSACREEVSLQRLNLYFCLLYLVQGSPAVEFKAHLCLCHAQFQAKVRPTVPRLLGQDLFGELYWVMYFRQLALCISVFTPVDWMFQLGRDIHNLHLIYSEVSK